MFQEITQYWKKEKEKLYFLLVGPLWGDHFHWLYKF